MSATGPAGRAGWRLLAALLVAAASGCASRVAEVDHRMLMPQGGEQVELEQRQLFVMPIPLAQPEPVFPALEGAAEPAALTVCAELWLSDDGAVTDVLPFDSAPDCAPDDDAGTRAYAQSVSEALRGWEFSPAMICDFPPEAVDKFERGDCIGTEVAVRRVAVRLAYAFTFSSRGGRRSVGVASRRAL